MNFCGPVRSESYIGQELGILQEGFERVRTLREANVSTPTARARLTVRGKPYWRMVEAGLHLGYRRKKSGGGSWTVRRFVGDGKYEEAGLGIADDLSAANGLTVLTFGQAQEAARKWWISAVSRELGVTEQAGPYLVTTALDEYFNDRKLRGSKGISQDQNSAKINIIPTLGRVEINKLTTLRIREWHYSLASHGRRARSARVGPMKAVPDLDVTDDDAVRARKASANRCLTILKAALNHAYQRSLVASDDAWRRVKPFRGVDVPVIRFLDSEEANALVKNCGGGFLQLVQGALVTGCRYGELGRLKVRDYNKLSGVLLIGESKPGKHRHVVLADAGIAFFDNLSRDKSPNDYLFVRDGGSRWRASDQTRPFLAASNAAGLNPAPSFNVLRHTYASRLAMRGVPMGVIAKQLGHADTRMTEKHYAHLAPNYVAETVRAALPNSSSLAAGE